MTNWAKSGDRTLFNHITNLFLTVKGKIHTFLKCIYYRAYSMVEIIIHLMCVKSLQLACN